MREKTMISVFYDSDCPICQSEIDHLIQKCPDKIIAVPVLSALDELNSYGIDKIDALTYLCVKDSGGQIYKGIEAVRLLHITADTPFAFWLKMPIIKQISGWVYPIFARHRYKIPKRITHCLFGKPKAECDNGACHIDPKNR